MNKVSDYIPAMPKEQKEKMNQQLSKVLKEPYIAQFRQQYQIPEEALFRSYSQILAFYQERQYFNQYGTSKQLPGYEPILEFVHGQVTMNYRQTSADFLNQQAKNHQPTYIDIPKSVRHASFDHLICDEHPDKLEVVKQLYDFIPAYLNDKTSFHKGIYLHGSYGVGKTYLMAALANELAKHNVKTILVNVATFISQLKGEFNQPTNQINEKIDRLKKAEVLILDDIGMETMSEWVRDDVLGIILQYRMQEELPTFFTSNLSMHALEQHLAETRQEQNQLRAERIMERVRYLSKEMTVNGQSLR